MNLIYLARDKNPIQTFEHGNKYSGSTKWGDYLDQLRNYYLVMKTLVRGFSGIKYFIYIYIYMCVCV